MGTRARRKCLESSFFLFRSVPLLNPLPLPFDCSFLPPLLLPQPRKTQGRHSWVAAIIIIARGGGEIRTFDRRSRIRYGAIAGDLFYFSRWNAAFITRLGRNGRRFPNGKKERDGRRIYIYTDTHTHVYRILHLIPAVLYPDSKEPQLPSASAREIFTTAWFPWVGRTFDVVEWTANRGTSASRSNRNIFLSIGAR